MLTCKFTGHRLDKWAVYVSNITNYWRIMTVIENNEIIQIYGTEFKENTKKLLVEADLAEIIK